MTLDQRKDWALERKLVIEIAVVVYFLVGWRQVPINSKHFCFEQSEKPMKTYACFLFLTNIQSVFDKTSWNHIQKNINANEWSTLWKNMIGFSIKSDWLRGWCEFSEPITKRIVQYRYIKALKSMIAAVTFAKKILSTRSQK